MDYGSSKCKAYSAGGQATAQGRGLFYRRRGSASTALEARPQAVKLRRLDIDDLMEASHKGCMWANYNQHIETRLDETRANIEVSGAVSFDLTRLHHSAQTSMSPSQTTQA